MEVETTITYRDQFLALDEAIDFVRTHAPGNDVPFTAQISHSGWSMHDDPKLYRVAVIVTGGSEASLVR